MGHIKHGIGKLGLVSVADSGRGQIAPCPGQTFGRCVSKVLFIALLGQISASATAFQRKRKISHHSGPKFPNLQSLCIIILPFHAENNEISVHGIPKPKVPNMQEHSHYHQPRNLPMPRNNTNTKVAKTSTPPCCRASLSGCYYYFI